MLTYCCAAQPLQLATPSWIAFIIATVERSVNCSLFTMFQVDLFSLLFTLHIRRKIMQNPCKTRPFHPVFPGVRVSPFFLRKAVPLRGLRDGSCRTYSHSTFVQLRKTALLAGIFRSFDHNFTAAPLATRLPTCYTTTCCSICAYLYRKIP